MQKLNQIYSICKRGDVVKVVLCMLTILSASSCREEKKETIRSFKNIKLVPTLKTTKVSTLISDSGITRYRLVTDEWLIYKNAVEPFWDFPKGVYVEKFDSAFRVQASIKADSARFYEAKRLWVLKKNVKILNLQGEKFETEELFWDQNLQKVFSNKFIKIEQANRVITGLGFESNESMTRYQIHKTQGVFQINETKNTP